MQYKNLMLALAATGCLFVNLAAASAASKDDVAQPRVSTNVNRSKVAAKQWPQGGINIITDSNGKTKDIIVKDKNGEKKLSDNDKDKRKYKDEERRRNRDKDKKETKRFESKNEQVKNASDDKEQNKKKNGKNTFGGIELPEDYRNISIYGDPVVDKSQAVALIKAYNPDVQLACSVEELVDLYWEEAGRENVRPDLALAQSLIETGYYRYGGDVRHHQNNFCGLGTTGGGVRGASFKTPQIGVRARILLLQAYTQKKRPQTKIVDPRYELAHSIRVERGVVDTWAGLNGTWAMGSSYCEKIMATYQKMLLQPVSERHDEDEDKKQDKKKAKKRTMRERVEELLRERNR